MHIDHRCHFEFWQGVVVEIALNHAAVFDIDSAVQGAAQAVDYGTLYLGLDDGRIDRLTAVDYAGDPVDPGSAAFVDGDFRDLGLVAVQVVDVPHTLIVSFRQRTSPSGCLLYTIQHPECSRVVPEQFSPQVNRIRTMLMGDLIHCRFKGKGIMYSPHGAPEADRYGHLCVYIVDLEIRDRITACL